MLGAFAIAAGATVTGALAAALVFGAALPDARRAGQGSGSNTSRY